MNELIKSIKLPTWPSDRPDMSRLFQETLKRDASDLHLIANMPPVFRIKGELCPMECPVFGPDEIKEMLYGILTPRHREVLEKKKSVDFALSVNNAGRFRAALYYQKGAISAAFRLLMDGINSFAGLNLPDSLSRLSSFRDGLVLVTGMTGSGKSTTLATVVDSINATSNLNIITIEDPIEYVHQNNKCIINQRELYVDVDSFETALRDALRADPDVILVGEMRDTETIRTAIMSAETGHLVFSTLHSRDCISSINRMVGAFPADEQSQIRQQLSSVLKALISPRLLQKASGNGRIPAVEIMFTTQGISNLIRQGKDDMIYSAIETGSLDGMQTMEQSLVKLINEGRITVETGLESAKNSNLLKQRLSAGKSGDVCLLEKKKKKGFMGFSFPDQGRAVKNFG